MRSQDRRYRKTETAIVEALIALLNKKDVQEVSISDVIEAADINRSTFYLHYSNLDDVYGAVEDQTISLLTSILPYISFLNGKNFTSELASLIMSRSDIFLSSYKGNPYRFKQKCISLFANYLKISKPSKNKKMPSTTYLKLEVLIDGINAMAFRFMETKGRLSRERFIAEMDDYIKSPYFKELLKKK